MRISRRRGWRFLILLPFVLALSHLWGFSLAYVRWSRSAAYVKVDDDPDFKWRKLPVRHPVESMRPLPTGRPLSLAKIQASFPHESYFAAQVRLERQAAVKRAFVRCWDAYRAHAWTRDELTPLTGSARDTFGGWGATLVDSLDTLWIMGLRAEFDEAVAAAANISFDTAAAPPGEINVFETTIRYLGGFLAAYDLSGDARLLRKAKEVADMLYVAFDTPNRMPVTRWDPRAAATGHAQQQAGDNVPAAEVGSLTMEFARLSLITGEPRYLDAVQRVMDLFDAQQHATELPGMWPLRVDARRRRFDRHDTFTLGAMADSLYEYLPKTYALLGGLAPAYRRMYEAAMRAAMRHSLFRPMLPGAPDLLVAGTVRTAREAVGGPVATALEPQGQHLACFAGGMLALGGRLFDLPGHLDAAHRLVDGCLWAYRALPLGIMPETFHMVPCPSPVQAAAEAEAEAAAEAEAPCPWDDKAWARAVLDKARADGRADDADADADGIIARERLPEGFTAIPDPRYMLRPEAIESVFVLYRATGRADLPDSAWAMFEAVQNGTRTGLANAALADVTVGGKGLPPPKSDSMESFWMGETLKYFYLVFSEPELVSLDEYVFNTEAHPFRLLLP